MRIEPELLEEAYKDLRAQFFFARMMTLTKFTAIVFLMLSFIVTFIYASLIIDPYLKG
jgi:hypothetical protein